MSERSCCGEEEEEEEEQEEEGWLVASGSDEADGGIGRSDKGREGANGFRSREGDGTPKGLASQEEEGEALAGQGWKYQCHCWHTPQG